MFSIITIKIPTVTNAECFRKEAGEARGGGDESARHQRSEAGKRNSGSGSGKW